MKKIFVFILSLMLTLSFALIGCQKKETPAPATEAPSPTGAPDATVSPAPEKKESTTTKKKAKKVKKDEKSEERKAAGY